MTHTTALAAAPVSLACDGGWDKCIGTVSMIGNKGYVYCCVCGPTRRQSGYERVRKVTASELRTLQSGEPLRAY